MPRSRQKRWQQSHLILFLEPADRGDFRHAGSRLQRRLDRALVQQTQLAQVTSALLVHERVLENPADAAGIGPDDDVGVGGKLRPDGAQPVGDVLANGRPPSSVTQDDVDEGVPHVRGAADRLDLRGPGERPDDRLGQLGFDDERAAGPLRVDDDLRVGDVGDCVERRGAQRVDAQGDQGASDGPDQPTVLDDAPDDGDDHAGGPG